MLRHWRVTTLAGLLLLLPVLARGQSTFVWTTNYYVVTGSNLREIRESLNLARPPKISPPMTALTEWRMSWRFAVVPSTSGCRCASFSTRLVITNTLPRWTPPTNATPELKAAWQRLFRNLARHEAGHSQIALAALAETHKRVKELPDDPDCEGVRSKVNALIRSVIEDYRQLDEDYDRRTEHGTKQGPVFRYPVRSSAGTP
jgi:predicted secreted Zn-dependent protease